MLLFSTKSRQVGENPQFKSLEILNNQKKKTNPPKSLSLGQQLKR